MRVEDTVREGDHLRSRFLSVAGFGGLTMWSAVAHPWMAPGFAVLAGAQALIIVFWVRLGRGRASTKPIVGFMALGYTGLAYLLSLAAGTPEGPHFWIVFSVALAILSPIVMLAPRLLFRRAELPD